MKTIILLLFLFTAVAFGIESNEQKCFPTGQDIRCDVCNFVVSEIAFQLKQNKSETSILNELSKGCDIFGRFRQECKLYVEIYGKQIIEYVVNIGEKNACNFLIYCKMNGGIPCTICEIAVKMIERLLEEKKTEDYIIKELEKFCHTIKFHEKECKHIVDKYGKKLIDFVIKYGLDKACVLSGLC